MAAAEGRRTAERRAEALAQRLREAEAASASAAQTEASEAGPRLLALCLFDVAW